VTKLHRDALKSDIESAKAILHELGARDPLGTMTFNRRLAALNEELSNLEGEAKNFANVALVFDGGPVRGSSAIDANFAGQALQEYQELITKHVARSTHSETNSGSKTAKAVACHTSMNVTALVHGSFGFILEEDDSKQTDMFESATRTAVHAVTDLLRDVIASDGQIFQNKLPDLDVKVFQSLRRFIGTLHKAEASLKLAEDERELKLSTSDVLKAYDRVSQVDVTEVDDTFVGKLLGLVPIARRFEFRNDEDEEIVSGKVALNLSADYLERIEREGPIEGKRWRALVRTKTISQTNGRHSSVSRVLLDLLATDEKPLDGVG
jgi:hypothetical protein